MQGFFSSVVSAVSVVFADENDREMPPAAVSPSDIEFAEVTWPVPTALCVTICAQRAPLSPRSSVPFQLPLVLKVTRALDCCLCAGPKRRDL